MIVASASTSGDARISDPIPHTEITPQPDSIWARAMNIIAEGGLPALLRHPINQELLHHCGICGQWLATPTALKNHYRSKHAIAFSRLAGLVDKLVLRSGIALNPCLYCNVSHRHPRQHLSHCVSCFLHSLSEPSGHDGSTDSPLADEVLGQLQSCFGEF